MMKRGDICIAQLDPTVGSEIKKTRPVLVVSNDANNKAASTVTIVPITSNVTKVYPFEVLLVEHNCGLTKPSKAQCHQVRTISKLRLKGQILGRLSHEAMRSINGALALHLGF